MGQIQPSIAHYYHERTKYEPETIGAKSQSIDWATQPVPFKEYKIGKSFDLKPYLKSEPTLSENPSTEEWWGRLSRLLLCSYGLTARLPTISGEDLYLRAAPSAGGLYPAEVYLISRGTSVLPSGIYNYQPKTHSLLRFWESNAWQTLKTACFSDPVWEIADIALVTTAIFQRSAWRYQDRAYRRMCLDTGHLLGNIELAAAINQFRPYLIGGFVDEGVNQLLYLDSQQEGGITVIPLVDLLAVNLNLPASRTVLPSPTQTEYPKIRDGELLEYFHKATQIVELLSPTEGLTNAIEDKYNFPFCLKVSTACETINWAENLSQLEATILNRRSTRAYSGAEIEWDELKAILNFTYQPHHYVAQGLDAHPDYFALDLIETFIAVSGVNGLEDGCYYYAPQARELRQIRFKNFRRELHYLCLGQELGRDAAAVVFHTADLKKAVAKYGDRVYRYLHLDAGHLGQKLNLAAIYLNLGVSGIGGFFDNQVNQVLDIPTDEAVLYITTIGKLIS
ncbi:SagB/ThcOx family dehydrogenase [Merismopedia glauca]|uniref:SagB-type dehydrogenase domain-containing protein n=1 Tax=Merismopedia glauca CCAP 1448/3 TaxID=1296344 RepID=A0A2T1C7R2_9CYAN|nr:SagB/ThcOx family dehydrogenase [Merismopedia glauca]PSB04198.1 SagB-type dehydrogenase domain-containing protein [Merismopedia glauca CCAP 1448/3]